MINLRKIAEQQKEQRALEIKNRILKQTNDIKLAESLSPITKKLDEVKKTTQSLGDVIKETQPKTPQPAIEHTPPPRPIENNEGVVYDVELETALNKMKYNIGFLNIEERKNGEIFWNGFPVEKMGDNKLKINEKIYGITPDIRKLLTEISNKPLKKINDEDRDTFNNLSESLGFENYKAIRGESKSRR